MRIQYMKKMKQLILLCCSIIMLVLCSISTNNTRLQAIGNGENVREMSISKQLDIPVGVEILKTLVHDDVIYTVGISSSKEAPYNLNGSETYAKIFVAKYNKDLKVESVVDTGYIFSFYKASLYHNKENQKTVVDKNEVERPLYEMYFVDGKLTIVGSASDSKKSSYIYGETVLEHHVKMVIAMQYDTSLKQLQKADFTFTNSTENVAYTSVVTEAFLYITYLPKTPGRFGPTQNEIVRYQLNDFKQKQTTNLTDEKRTDSKSTVYKTMIRYKDGLALEQGGVGKWDYFSKDLKYMGKVKDDHSPVLEDFFANEGSYEDGEVNPSFKTNSGGVYRFSRFSSQWWASGKEGQSTVDAAQDEKGQIVTLNMDSTLKPTVVIRDAAGEMTGRYFSFEPVSKKSTNMNVSTAENKIVVVIFQKLYLFENDAKVQVDKAGEFNNVCYNDVVPGDGRINYYDSVNNTCYISQLSRDDSSQVKSEILKDGKNFIDFKNSQLIQPQVYIKVTSMFTNKDGNLVVSGNKEIYFSDGDGTPYTAIIDQNGKIIKEVLDTNLKLQDKTLLTKIGYLDIRQVDQNYIFTGKQKIINFMEPNAKKYTVPFIQIKNTDLENIEILFNKNEEKYKNAEIESLTRIGQQYLKISLRKSTTNKREAVLYNLKEKKIIDSISKESTTEVVSGEKTFLIKNKQIIEKDSKGKELSKQPLKLEKGQITPIKRNNQYIVSSVNKKNKLQFNLIDKDGETLQTLATEHDVSKNQIVIYFNGTDKSQKKINFSITDENGNSSTHEVDVTSLKAKPKEKNTIDEKQQLDYLIPGMLIASTAIAIFTILIIRKRKKEKTSDKSQ